MKSYAEGKGEEAADSRGEQNADENGERPAMRYSYDAREEGSFCGTAEDTNANAHRWSEDEGGGREEEGREGLMLGNRHACKMRRKKSAVCVWRQRFSAASLSRAIFHPERLPPTTQCLSTLSVLRKNASPKTYQVMPESTLHG